jgi:NADH-quinone oxidoreductase subunit N
MNAWEMLATETRDFVLPELILVAAVLSTLVLGRVAEYRARTVIVPAALVALAAHIAVSRSAAGLLPIRGFRNSLVVDLLSIRGGTVALTVLVLGLLAGFRARGNREGSDIVPCLMTLATVGAMLAATCTDLFALCLAVELAALPGYAVAVGSNGARGAVEDAFGAFVRQLVATSSMLFGVALLHDATGTTYVREMTLNLGRLMCDPGGTYPSHWRELAIAGSTLFVLGLIGKLGVLPTYHGGRRSFERQGVAVFAVILRVAAFVALVRFVGEGLPPAADAPCAVDLGGICRGLVAFGGAVAVVVATASALGERRPNRSLHFVGVTNLGYALLGVASGTVYGIASACILVAASSFSELAVASAARLRTPGDAPSPRRRTRVLSAMAAAWLVGLPPSGVFVARACVVAALFRGEAWWTALAASLAAVAWAATLVHSVVVTREVALAVRGPGAGSNHAGGSSIAACGLALAIALLPAVAFESVRRFTERAVEGVMRKPPPAPGRPAGPPRAAGGTIGVPGARVDR